MFKVFIRIEKYEFYQANKKRQTDGVARCVFFLISKPLLWKMEHILIYSMIPQENLHELKEYKCIQQYSQP